MDGQKRDYLSRALQHVRGATKKPSLDERKNKETFSLIFLCFSCPLVSIRRLYGIGLVGCDIGFLNTSTTLGSGIGCA